MVLSFKLMQFKGNLSKDHGEAGKTPPPPTCLHGRLKVRHLVSSKPRFRGLLSAGKSWQTVIPPSTRQMKALIKEKLSVV